MSDRLPFSSAGDFVTGTSESARPELGIPLPKALLGERTDVLGIQ